jgi:hypothetical protein
MLYVRRSLLLSALLLAGCDSKVTSTTDPALQKQIVTITNCFPGLFPKAEGLLAVAETWRMNAGASIPDPADLTHSGTGPISLSYTFDGCTLAMTIRFYDPDGNEQTSLPLTASSLADRIDEAATSLRTSFPTGNPFLVGDWTLTGSGVSGSGALTGIIGGTGTDNELVELRTTDATPSSGPPAVATSSVTDGACTLTFRTDSLATDSFTAQEYPIGTMTVTLDGDDADSIADVTATITFDNSPVVVIEIAGTVSGHFEFNVETRAFVALP